MNPSTHTDAAAGSPDPLARLRLLGWDEAYLVELSGLFLEECPRLVGEVRDALAAGDAEGVRRAAHTLRGLLGHFDAGRACDAAARLEEIGRGGGLAGAAAPWAELEEAVNGLPPAFAALAAPAAGAEA